MTPGILPQPRCRQSLNRVPQRRLHHVGWVQRSLITNWATNRGFVCSAATANAANIITLINVTASSMITKNDDGGDLSRTRYQRNVRAGEEKSERVTTPNAPDRMIRSPPASIYSSSKTSSDRRLVKTATHLRDNRFPSVTRCVFRTHDGSSLRNAMFRPDCRLISEISRRSVMRKMFIGTTEFSSQDRESATPCKLVHWSEINFRR